jgi:hypothetical protein
MSDLTLLPSADAKDRTEARDWAENELVGREELGRAHDEGDPRRAYVRAMPDYLMMCDMDLAIPGYVMWDFERNRGEGTKRSKETP